VRIAGRGQAFTPLKGSFQGLDVQLGDLLTDREGRLIVLGGFGTSQSVRPLPLDDFVNNDGWRDDVSDGPVRATIQLNGSGDRLAAEPAWVIVAPPDFAAGNRERGHAL
jgi:L-Lysine epsilon oxidase N-terminal